jgi:hypothetical protein
MNPIPPGFRQCLVTAITVFLAFSLAFVKYWSFDTEGVWWWGNLLTEIILIASIILQIYVLARALNINDDKTDEYKKTVRYFLRSICILILSVILGVFFDSGIISHL